MYNAYYPRVALETASGVRHVISYDDDDDTETLDLSNES